MVQEKSGSFTLDSFLFPRLFSSFRMAIQPSRLATAYLAVAVIAFSGWVIHLLRGALVGDSQTTAAYVPISDRAVIDPVAFLAARFHNALFALLDLDFSGFVGAVADCFRMLAWTVADRPISSLLFFVIALATLSLAGGGIARSVALQFAQDRRTGFMAGLRFGTRSFQSLFGALMIPLGLILLSGLPIALLGLIGRIPYLGEILAAILLPLAFVAGVLITVLLVGTAAAGGLMLPAIGYDGSDSFDAVGRPFAYAFAKPWHLGFYALVAAFYGAVCYFFIRFCAFLLLWVVREFLSLGFWGGEKLAQIWAEPTFTALLGSPQPMPETWSMWIAALLIRLWVLAVAGVVAAYVVSFYFTAGTICYALMRHCVDGTPIEEIYEAPGEGRQPPPSQASSPETGEKQTGE